MYRLFVTALAGTLVACASSIRAPAAEGYPESATAILVVENAESVDVAVRLVNGADELPIGVAPGARCTSFAVPTRVLGRGQDLRLAAQVPGRRETFVSERFDTPPGYWTQWILAQLRFSTLLLHWKPHRSVGTDEQGLVAALISGARCRRLQERQASSSRDGGI